MTSIASLGLLALSAIPQASPAAPDLLEPPEGWVRERLEFPLSFAPTLAYRGFEDLAFAPGMFQRGSDGYFSYVLAMRLDGDVELDAPALDAFLEAYFGGLYTAVAADRGLPTADRPTRAEVWRDGAAFHARVDSFDAFTDGSALALRLELFTRALPDSTLLLGLASPAPADAPIWTTLREIHAKWSAARPAPTLINHVYAVVDAESYAKLAASKLMREEFGVCEERTTRRADITYTGLYFYGQRTYFEFLGPQPAANLAGGSSGVAFASEEPAGLERWAQRLTDRSIATQTVPVTREWVSGKVPWFRMTGVQMPKGQFTLFSMEYQPEFLSRWHPPAASEQPTRAAGIARRDVLDRYARALGQSDRRDQGALLDLASIELTLSAEQAERWLEVARACEHDVGESTANSARTQRLRVPQCDVILHTADAPGGLTAFEVTLRRPVDSPPLDFGGLRVRFDANRARFEIVR